MDLILTGRAVGAEEALRIGLADRVVPRGGARPAAEALAREIAAFPPICALSDRRSAYEQASLPLADALANEARLGDAVLRSGEALAGAKRFASGIGRHGKF
jgi:enoyl-CoA hydratase